MIKSPISGGCVECKESDLDLGRCGGHKECMFHVSDGTDGRQLTGQQLPGSRANKADTHIYNTTTTTRKNRDIKCIHWSNGFSSELNEFLI